MSSRFYPGYFPKRYGMPRDHTLDPPTETLASEIEVKVTITATKRVLLRTAPKIDQGIDDILMEARIEAQFNKLEPDHPDIEWECADSDYELEGDRIIGTITLVGRGVLQYQLTWGGEYEPCDASGDDYRKWLEADGWTDVTAEEDWG